MAAFPKYTYKHLTSGTTLVKPSGGTLYAIVVNKALSGTVTVSDGANGTVAILTNGTTAPLGTVIFNVQMGNQIQVALSGTEDITVCFE